MTVGGIPDKGLHDKTNGISHRRFLGNANPNYEIGRASCRERV